MMTSGSRACEVHKLDSAVEVVYGEHDLGHVGMGLARVDGVGNPMNVDRFGEVVGYDDLRAIAGGGAGERIESFGIRLELQVDVRESLSANFFHQRGAASTALAALATLALRAQRRDGALAQSSREMAHRLCPQAGDAIEPELDEIGAFPEGHPSLTLGFRGVPDQNHRRDLGHVIAPKSSLESACRSGGRLPPLAGGPPTRPGGRSLPGIRRRPSRIEPFPHSGRSWSSGGHPFRLSPPAAGGHFALSPPQPPHAPRPSRPPPTPPPPGGGCCGTW